MSARQGRALIVLVTVVFSVLLALSAARHGEWVGFAVTELQIAVPMALAWRALSVEPRGRSQPSFDVASVSAPLRENVKSSPSRSEPR